MPPCMLLEVSIFLKFVRTYGTCMHYDKPFITYLHCSSPYKFLILTKVAPYFVGTDGSNDREWHFLGGVRHPCPTLEGVALRGVHGTAPLFLDYGVPERATMVWSTTDYPYSYTSTPMAGVESGIRGKNSLGRCPSGCFWGAEQDLPAAREWDYR